MSDQIRPNQIAANLILLTLSRQPSHPNRTTEHERPSLVTTRSRFHWTGQGFRVKRPPSTGQPGR